LYECESDILQLQLLVAREPTTRAAFSLTFTKIQDGQQLYPSYDRFIAILHQMLLVDKEARWCDPYNCCANLILTLASITPTHLPPNNQHTKLDEKCFRTIGMRAAAQKGRGQFKIPTQVVEIALFTVSPVTVVSWKGRGQPRGTNSEV